MKSRTNPYRELPEVVYNPPVMARLESWRGSDIVAWYGRIQTQLEDMMARYERDRNQSDADQVGAFLKTWRDHPISGSINIEEVEILFVAASMLAAAHVKPKKYFGALRDQLARLKASEEELPTVPSSTGADAAMPAKSMPSVAGQFAPTGPAPVNGSGQPSSTNGMPPGEDRDQPAPTA